jgi:hypothetical protein
VCEEEGERESEREKVLAIVIGRRSWLWRVWRREGRGGSEEEGRGSKGKKQNGGLV